MNNPPSSSSKQLAILPDNSPYEVGYKKPPKQSQFKKGTSGNPRGRPKGAKNKQPAMNEERLKNIVLQEAYRTVPVQDQGKSVSIPLAQAVIRSLAVSAAKGNTRAQHLFTQLLANTETTNRQQHDAMMEAAINFKVEWEREFERCDRLGIPRPDVIPHPDDVLIDFRKGTVHFKGPMTKEEKAEIEKWRKQKAGYIEEIEYLIGELAKATTNKDRAFWQAEIAHSEKVLTMIKRLIPDEDDRH